MCRHFCYSLQGGILHFSRCLPRIGGRCSWWRRGLIGRIRKAGRVPFSRRFTVIMVSIGSLMVGWLSGLQNRTGIQDVTF